MSLEDTIRRVTGRSLPTNEANTIDRIIFPVLKDLGWDIHHELDSLPEVEREWSVGKKQQGGGQRADIALLNNDNDVQNLLCLIEAKSPTQKLDDHTGQLVQQAFYGGARICILTNGIHWRIYLPFERGSISERRLPIINLETDLKESVNELKKLLGRIALHDGSAEAYAKQRLRNQNSSPVIDRSEGQLTSPPEEGIQSVSHEIQIPQEDIDTYDHSKESRKRVVAERDLLFRDYGEPYLIEKPESTASLQDQNRWKASEQVYEAADLILARCEDSGFELEDMSNIIAWTWLQFESAFQSAGLEWLDSNKIDDERFDEDLWSDELGYYFSYSHYCNTRGRFEAILAAERLFNELVDKLKAEFGNTYFLYSDYMCDLMRAVSHWSGKQDENGFMASDSTLSDLMSDETISGILADLSTEFADSPANLKTHTPANPSSSDPLAFTFLGKEHRAKSKVGVVRDLLSLVHQQPPEGLQALEGESIGIFLSSEKDELNLFEQIRGTHFYFEKDWFAYDLVLYLYLMCDEFNLEREDLTISYPHGPVGVGDIFKPEYPDFLHDRSVNGKITATSEDGSKELVVEFPSPKPSEIRFLGESRQVKSHADAARTALSQMVKVYSKSFHRFEYSPVNRAYFISKDPDDFARAGKIPKTDYYLNSLIFSQPKNPEMLDLIFARMMSVFGYTLDDYSVNWRWHVKKR